MPSLVEPFHCAFHQILAASALAAISHLAQQPQGAQGAQGASECLRPRPTWIQWIHGFHWIRGKLRRLNGELLEFSRTYQEAKLVTNKDLKQYLARNDLSSWVLYQEFRRFFRSQKFI